MTEKLFQEVPIRVIKASLGAALLLGPLILGALGAAVWWLLPLAIVGGLLARDDLARFLPKSDPVSSYISSIASFAGGALILYFIGYLVGWVFGLF